MQQSEQTIGVLAVANLREYFHDALQGALVHQQVAVEDQTEHYVVNLLTLFARSEHLYEQPPTACGCNRWCRCCPRRSRRPRPRSVSAACSAWAMCRCSSPDSSPTASRAS